jgi:hypothetical protein
MSRDQLISTLASLNQLGVDQKGDGPDLKPEEYGALERVPTDTDGLWQWSYPDGSYGGILGLYGLKNGGVRGFSLIDTTLSDQAKEHLGAEHVAAAIPLRGSFAQSAGSKERTIKFTMYGAGSAHIETTVSLSEDGTRLKGRSRILSGMKDEHGNDLSYSWTAERFKMP